MEVKSKSLLTKGLTLFNPYEVNSVASVVDRRTFYWSRCCHIVVHFLNASLGVKMHIVKPDLVTGAAFVRDI